MGKKLTSKKQAAPEAFDPSGLTFLFTGKLASMTRSSAQARVKAIGGVVAAGVTPRLDVLVVGDDGSPLYGAGSKGDKQVKAEALNAKGARIRIISETAFLTLGASATPAIPEDLPDLVLVGRPKDHPLAALCGATFDNDTLYIVGGLGENHVLSTRDGSKLTDIRVLGGGLRGVAVDGKRSWLSGEYGALYYSASGFGSFKQIKLRTSACLHGLARAKDGSIWVGGDDGFLARSTNGTTFKRVGGIRDTVNKIRATGDGVLIPTDKGLYQATGDKLKKLGLPSGANMAMVTRDGSIVAVSNKNTIFRSTDGGKRFQRSKTPGWSPTRLAKNKQYKRAYWVVTGKDLNVVAQLGDGRIIAAGDDGVILCSSDDGATFRRVDHAYCNGSFWAAGTRDGKVFLGGENRALVRVE